MGAGDGDAKKCAGRDVWELKRVGHEPQGCGIRDVTMDHDMERSAHDAEFVTRIKDRWRHVVHGYGEKAVPTASGHVVKTCPFAPPFAIII